MPRSFSSDKVFLQGGSHPFDLLLSKNLDQELPQFVFFQAKLQSIALKEMARTLGHR